MPTQRTNAPISQWQDGDSISGFVLLTKKERRQDRNGRDFIDLRLTDVSGSMDGKIWGDSPALDGNFEAHDFVAIKGVVKSYRDRLQLTVQNCRRATDDDRTRGFEESRLVPSAAESLDDLWSRLETVYRERIDDPHLSQLAATILASHGDLLREHPAAKSIHHAYRGGLLEHVLSMAELAIDLCPHYPDVSLDLVLLGILFHDLGKIRELGQMPRNDYTTEGRLIGHVVMGRDLLREACQEIDGFPPPIQTHLEHLVLSHQGLLEFGSPVEPMTAEAVVLHAIDNLDAKLAQLREAAREADGFQYLRGFGRYLLLSDGDDVSEAEEETDVDARQLELDT